MKYRLLVTFMGLLLAAGPAAIAQRLSGKVLDASTGQPVPYASIAVLSSAQGTTSNAEGEFEIGGVALPARLVVSELGHQRDTVAVAAAATQPLLIRLQPASVQLPDVVLGTYTEELIRQAYRELSRTHARKTYGQAFYRQITRLDSNPTEVQEMVWHTQTSNARVEGSAMVHGRFAKKKALLAFKDFSLYTKAVTFFDSEDDSISHQGVIGLRVAENYSLKLVGLTQNGAQQLAEISFVNKNPNARTRQGSVVIDEATHHILRLRVETTGLSTKSNNPMFKFHNEITKIEWVFQAKPGGTAALEHLEINYKATMSRPLKSNLAIEVSSVAYFYDHRPTPAAGVAYTPAKGGVEDLTAIKETTYDPVFWQNNAVVKRTPLEEEVIKSFEQKGAFGTMLTP